MLIERPLNATPRTQGAHSTNVNDKHYKVTADLSVTEAFLVKHSTAKIVFIVDTHCLENGYFVYKGASPKTYEACSLLEVSMLYAPRQSSLIHSCADSEGLFTGRSV